MTDEQTPEPTPGVLIKGEDGTHYFIPHTELSQFAVGSLPDVAESVAAAAPRLDAFTVQQTSVETEDTAAAFFPMAE